MSDSMRPHRRQPTRLHRPWDSTGKNTEVGCHSLLQGIFPTQDSNSSLASPSLRGGSLPAEPPAAKSLQSCPTLCNPTYGSPLGSAVPGILQARTLEWIAFPSPMHASEKWKWSRSVVSDPQRSHGLQPSRLLHPWDFPGKSTRVGCHCLDPKSLQSQSLPFVSLLLSLSFDTWFLLLLSLVIFWVFHFATPSNSYLTNSP